MGRFVLVLSFILSLSARGADWAALNERARTEALRPVKPGEPGKSPFWNIKARAFIHPPAFDFKPVAGAKAYRFTVTEKADGKSHSFSAEHPWAPLTPVWGEIAPGYVTVKCEGLGADGAALGVAGTRECYRAAFFKGPYPQAADRDYAAAAHRCFASVYRLPQVQGWLTQDSPPEGYDLYCYPSKLLSSMINALLRFAERAPSDEAAKAVTIARRMADWLIAASQPEGTPLEYLPPTYWGDRRDIAVKYAGMNMLLYPVNAANAYFALYAKTGEARYRDAGLRIAGTMRKIQNADGTWPLKVREKDGKPVRDNRLVTRGEFDRMFAKAAELSGDRAFAEVAARARRYENERIYPEWNWDGQFEDIDPLPRYYNLTKHNACDFAGWLFDRGRTDEAKELLAWTEDQFVVWSDPIHHMDWQHWKMPTALEQYEYYTPIDASMARFIEHFAKAYARTGDALYLEKARALADCVLRHQRKDGTIPTYFDTRKGSDWVNCMVSTATSLEKLAKAVAISNDAGLVLKGAVGNGRDMTSSVILDGRRIGSLERAFSHPPHAAKPHVWYHMMNGNVTKAGITADFEALAKIGIGGVQMFDAGCEIPAGPVDFNSPAWFDMMEHAAKEARRLGLEMCVPNCSGWSSSGGPWIAPSNGMKIVTWREARTTGPSRFKARLDRDANDNGFYEDIAVLAFPTPAAERETFPDVKGSVDGGTATLISARPFAASGISLTLDFPSSWSGDADFSVEASEDGLAFKELESFSLPLSRSGIPDRSSRFHPFPESVTARALRVKLVKSSPKATIREVRPKATMAISNLRAKTFEIRQELKLDRTTALADQLVRKETVRDLTKLMSADGTLTWDVPSGDWTIVRVGCKCNGKHNHPASRRGVGLEVDKLSASALNFHFDQYAAVLRRKLGPLAGDVETGFNNVLVDSYEVGSQNWTQGFEKDFERQTGYSLLPYLPALAGRIVGSVDETERFLEDFRRVIADLFARNYADALAKKCHESGLKLSLEPYGNCPADNLQYGASVDIPMGEFWSRAGRGDFCAESGITAIPSSLAHVWGRRIAAAEAFTASPGDGGRWRTTPFSIKAQCDRAYAGGINRMIYHRFVHQPWVSPAYLPGMTMGRWGMHFDRTQTWWDFADEWIRYQSRCQAMLQEGTFVADVLFYCGEHAPNEGNQYGGDKPVNMSLGGGYSADVCSKDALIRLRVEDGRVVAPGGVRYAMLVLPGCTTMGRAVLAKVEELVAAGAKVCGAVRPTRSPGLVGYPHADREIAEKSESVWARGILSCPPAEGLRRLGLKPDFSAHKDASFIHRRNSSADWYFVSMPNRESISFEASFRETGRIPEIWNPETGDVADASEWRQENGRTVVRLSFEPSGSAFVVFRRRTSATRAFSPPERIRISRTISGPWQVDFPNGYRPNALAEGASESVVFTNLVDWSVHPSELIRYFSGTATYRKRESLNGDGLKGKRVMLDLGSVRNVAKVTVNGKSYPSLWRPPFRVDITDVVSAEEKSSNPGLDIVVQVANLWANRLIGDDRLYESDCEWKGAKTPAGVKEIGIVRIPKWVKEGGKSPTGRATFTTWKHWDKDDELLPSGLIGPVRILTAEPGSGGLDWRLGSGTTRTGDVVTVRSPSGGSAFAKARIDLRPFAGGQFKATIRARGKGVEVPPLPYNGLKFMLSYVDKATGERHWPGARGRTGDFNWETFVLRRDLAGVDVDDGELTLGLEKAGGEVEFDLSSLKIEDASALFARDTNTVKCVYTDRVSKMPRRRGVMLPARPCVEDDFRTLREWGANLARFQMIRGWDTTGGNRDVSEFGKWLDGRLDHLEKDVLPWAQKYGLDIVIDMHVAPGGLREDRQMSMFFEEKYADAFVELWRMIARRFAGRPGIYGYDLINEPVQDDRGLSGGDWYDLQVRAAKAIREVDPVTPIIMESNGADSPTTYGHMRAVDLPNVIYQAHMYIPGDFTHQGVKGRDQWKPCRYPDPNRGWDKAYLRRQLQQVRDFQLRHDARIYIGEFSAIAWAEGADQYLRDCISVFEEYGWDWTYHAFREWSGWSVEHSCSAPGEAFVPSGENLRLRALKDGFRLNK